MKRVLVGLGLVSLSYSSACFSEVAPLLDQRGNGGGVVVCRDEHGTVKNIEVLDIYEAKFRGMELDFGPPASDPMVIVDRILDRWATVDDVGAAFYRDLAHRFFDPGTTKFLHGYSMPFIEDTGTVIPPRGCQYEQMVIQKEPSIPEDRLFVVDLDLFNLLDVNNKAAMILHEVIYNDVIAKPSEGLLKPLEADSSLVRLRNERFMKKDWAKINYYEYSMMFPNLEGKMRCDDFANSQSAVSYCKRHVFKSGQMVFVLNNYSIDIDGKVGSITNGNNRGAIRVWMEFLKPLPWRHGYLLVDNSKWGLSFVTVTGFDLDISNGVTVSGFSFKGTKVLGDSLIYHKSSDWFSFEGTLKIANDTFLTYQSETIDLSHSDGKVKAKFNQREELLYAKVCDKAGTCKEYGKE